MGLCTCYNLTQRSALSMCSCSRNHGSMGKAVLLYFLQQSCILEGMVLLALGRLCHVLYYIVSYMMASTACAWCSRGFGWI